MDYAFRVMDSCLGHNAYSLQLIVYDLGLYGCGYRIKRDKSQSLNFGNTNERDNIPTYSLFPNSSFSNPNPSTVASNHCPRLPRPVAPVPTSAPRDYPTFDKESREIHGCSDVGNPVRRKGNNCACYGPPAAGGVGDDGGCAVLLDL
ncbi:hypothetical protein LXL04_027418 [Taraxacum kok-saghyz]